MGLAIYYVSRCQNFNVPSPNSTWGDTPQYYSNCSNLIARTDKH